jgi:hypothetical protein
LPISYFYSTGYTINNTKKYKSKCKKCYEQRAKDKIINCMHDVFVDIKCCICGYSKCKQAIEFHHLDPSKKEYVIKDLKRKNIDIAKKELSKGILVCANCHREIHYGFHPEYLLK